jgi:hypothetical protein
VRFCILLFVCGILLATGKLPPRQVIDLARDSKPLLRVETVNRN